MQVIDRAVDGVAADTVDDEASTLMKRGIALMRIDDIEQALACFDRAREHRERLPLDDVPLFRYGLAACWLNRAEALMRYANGARLPEALDACDTGIALLQALPLCTDSRFPRRLAIAQQNRGAILHRFGVSHLQEALAALTEALRVLDADSAASITDRPQLRAAAHLRIALLHVSSDTATAMTDSRAAARRAMQLVAGTEEKDADAADIGLQARHALCHALARQLPDAAAGMFAPAEYVHAATDAADEGLALARHWDEKGERRFRGMAVDFFRFGARVYARFQPQFLAEFIDEQVDPARWSPDYVGSAEVQAALNEARQFLLGRPIESCARRDQA